VLMLQVGLRNIDQWLQGHRTRLDNSGSTCNLIAMHFGTGLVCTMCLVQCECLCRC
jgi:hypothetical protein